MPSLGIECYFFLVRTGTQWRNLSSEYPKWTAVNYYFERWTKDGTIEKINLRLTAYNGIFAQGVTQKGYIFEKAGRLDEGSHTSQT